MCQQRPEQLLSPDSGKSGGGGESGEEAAAKEAPTDNNTGISLSGVSVDSS